LTRKQSSTRADFDFDRVIVSEESGQVEGRRRNVIEREEIRAEIKGQFRVGEPSALMAMLIPLLREIGMPSIFPVKTTWSLTTP